MTARDWAYIDGPDEAEADMTCPVCDVEDYVYFTVEGFDVTWDCEHCGVTVTVEHPDSPY